MRTKVYTKQDQVEVDRVEETLITRTPSYAATEQFVRDVAAERRVGLFQFNRIMGSMLAFLEILLALRFLLKLIAANPDSGFAVLVFGLTGLFAAPFIGLVQTPTLSGSPVEITTLIAMLVYALIFWGVIYIIRLVVDPPGTRSFVRIAHEQSLEGKGKVRTTHTTISNGKI
jgi:uncharacterized membrane protein